MARLMEILKVERIVPNLLYVRAVERGFAHLKLDNKYNWPNQEDCIHPTAHARDFEFEEKCAAQSLERLPQNLNLFQPSYSLCRC